MSHFGKSIHHCKNSGVTFEEREPRDEVQGDLSPRMGGNGEWLQQTHPRSGGGLVVGTDGACLHILLNLPLHGRPPKPLGNGMDGPFDPQMAGE